MEIHSDRKLQSRAMLGVGLMILGLALYPISDAFIKHLMGTYPVHQTTFLRALMRLIPLFMVTFFQGGPRAVLTTKDPVQHLIRLAVNLAYTYAFMYAFSMGSLTFIYTLSYTSPFFMILLGSLLLKEKVSLDRWGAVAVGLIGVVIAMRPTSAVFELGAILILFATFLGALNKILMRRLAATEHSLSIAIYPNIVMIVVTLPFLLSTWISMPLEHWALFAIVGILTAAGQYAIAQALRFTQASTLASIDYSTFFWVVALDFLWWSKTPEMYPLVGAVIIVGSNLYIVYKTRKESRKKVVLSG
jgi:drug/metabolite transporter (DMT)-like permease